MLRAAKRMTGYKIIAVDGSIGQAADWHFDSRSWAVRYLEVDAGGWLSGRHVLLAPQVLGDVDEDMRTIEVGLNSEQVRSSPPREAGDAITRSYETELQSYFGWPAYWSAGMGLAPLTPVGPEPSPGDFGPGGGAARAPSAEDDALLSASEAAGYAVEATDGSIGSLQDMIIDDEDWVVRYLLVDTRPWWPGGQVIVAADWVSDVRNAGRAVAVDLTREAVRNSPPFDPSKPVNREYERKLYEHYGKGEQ